MLNNRSDRRNGLILSNTTFTQQRKSYGKYNKGSKARYNLNDLVLDLSSSPGNRNSSLTNRSSLNSTQAFDISNDSFKLSDDEYEGAITTTINRKSSLYQDEDTDLDFGNLGDLSDVPYGMTQLVSVAISDNEDSDATVDTPEKKKKKNKKSTSAKRDSRQLQESTPIKGSSHTSKKSKSVLQELSPVPINSSSNILTMDINEKRTPMAQSQQPPSFSRNNSSGLRNRSSMNSQSSKRWSLLSFNGDDKENLGSTKNKRFSIASGQSTSSKDKSKRFSIASTLSTTSSSSSSFRNAVTKVSNALTSVSVSSGDDSNDSTPYKNVQPGVVGDNERIGSPANPRKYSMATTASTNNVTVTSSIQNQRAQQYTHPMTTNTAAVHPPTSASAMRIPSGASHDDKSDQITLASTNSSLKSSRSRFRLSTLFSNSKKDLPINGVAGDNESVRSLRGKSSFSDMRKSVLSYSQSKTSLFRLTKKDSIHDLKKKPSLDKSMISLPKPDSDSANRLKSRLKSSSSILSINSVISRQQTINTINTTATTNPSSNQSTSAQPPCSKTKSNNMSATPVVSIEYDDEQLKDLLSLTSSPCVLKFDDYISKLTPDSNQILVKFAEASYSEVFVLKNFETGENIKVFKVIPFGEVNFDQPTLSNILQELRITKRLSGLEGFINLNDSCVVRGEYPQLLMKLWDDFNELKGSQNLRPEYETNQSYLILDLEYGGVDLESFPLMTWSQALEVFWSVVKTLDMAEREMRFEHRDLHLGNLVVSYKKNDAMDDETLEDAFKDLSIVEEEDESEGSQLCVKLIDYTLSRLDDVDGSVIFTRLDHQDFFKGRGYQFDIYRFMRNEVISKQAATGSAGDEIDWSLSSFKNNLFWLHFLLHNMLHSKGIKDIEGRDYQREVEYLHKCLDPRKKKLNRGEPVFKKTFTNNKSMKKKQQQRPATYFEDFESCADVLKFGEFYKMV